MEIGSGTYQPMAKFVSDLARRICTTTIYLYPKSRRSLTCAVMMNPASGLLYFLDSLLAFSKAARSLGSLLFMSRGRFRSNSRSPTPITVGCGEKLRRG
jgi:hypothetical protein